MDSTKDRDHQRFLSHLAVSKAAVENVATWLRDKGYTVIVPETKFAPTYEEWKRYADDGDLRVWNPAGGDEMRLEVKRRSVDFFDGSDWPHPDFIVMAKHAWDLAEIKPTAVIVLNAKQTRAGIVCGEDHDQWTYRLVRDRRYEDEVQEFYFTTTSAVRWVDFSPSTRT